MKRSLKVKIRETTPFTYQLTCGEYKGIEVNFLEQIAKELDLSIAYVFSNESNLHEQQHT